MKPSNVLILPGWQGSGPEHWQSRWERAHGYQRVEQHDWMRPLRGDWIARLEDVVLSCDEPAVLVAHSLGCIQVAAWAAHSRSTHHVKGALLVAPGDVERDDIDPLLWSWPPIPLQKLPFRSVLLGSRNDPWCDFDRARRFATAWGAQFIDYGDAGHINAEAGLGSWPEGYVLLDDLMKD
ncbi:alpha/beta hydrolase [Polaromonas sp. C04]|uniref:RBBP9/YdeN family alpha/beta hydrolase n=1 Tax=Polaromonas sp. C04 TaxID=1945857 RepID=UPI00098427F8|nr:alpha/beta hydrolase [Polaromonas sp. C04]OOG53402.1 alpha/beta hydrolase [Polaromonas sp. C04]